MGGEGRYLRSAALAVRVGVAGVTGACSSGPTEPPAEYVYSQPEVTGDGWTSASLESVGIDPAPIVEAVKRIRSGYYPRVHAIVIVRHGQLVLEEYFPGRLYVNPVERFGPQVDFDRDRTHQLASVTKSITSTLAGLAIDHGFIVSEDVPVYTFLPEYQSLLDERERGITVRHLLTMTSGWAWSENTAWGVTSNDMYGFNVAPDPLAYLFSKEMEADPGMKWVYNGGAVTLLGKIIEKASGLDLETFSERYLFTPMGIAAFSWPHMRPNLIAAHGDARLRPRDMAKLGQMFLEGGTLAGRRIVSDEWVGRATRGALEGDYGYLWWGDHYRGGQAAFRSYSALGWGGQCIHVFPELDMVVVFTGGNYETFDPVDSLMEAYVLRAVEP